jgi:uncharacterized LabA/DUF88 family protein
MTEFLNKKISNNYAFIDGQNLYLAVLELGWKIDFKRFRIYLKEKYNISKAYMFMGFLPSNQELYNFLQTAGFVIIFKPILENKNHKVKGNIDAELVLQTMIDLQEYDKAVIITGDGDFYCLVKYLDSNNKLARVLSPSPDNCSSLLTKIAGKKIAFVSDLKDKIEYKKKRTP